MPTATLPDAKDQLFGDHSGLQRCRLHITGEKLIVLTDSYHITFVVLLFIVGNEIERADYEPVGS